MCTAQYVRPANSPQLAAAAGQGGGGHDERVGEQEADWAARGILFEGKSHEEGRNAAVTLHSDRIERVKERSFASLEAISPGGNLPRWKLCKRPGETG